MAIYMLVEGVTGSSTEKEHKGWIPIKSCDFPVDRPGVNTRPGKITDRLRSSVIFPQITVTKDSDVASPGLMKWMVDGLTKEVTIAFCKEKGEKVTVIILTNTLVTNMQTTCSNDEQPNETIKLDFTKILMEYATYDEKNKPLAPAKVSYDLGTASSS